MLGSSADSATDLLNAVICVAVLSIGVSGIFAGSRTLLALSETGYVPRIYGSVDKSGRPLVGLVHLLLFSLLAHINVTASSDTIFTWLTSLSGLSTLFTWGSICIAHIRFRQAWKAQVSSTGGIAVRRANDNCRDTTCASCRSVLSVVSVARLLASSSSCWFSSPRCIRIVALTPSLAHGNSQFYVALWPLGGMSDNSAQVAKDFFQAYLALPVILPLTAIGYLGWRRKPQRVADINLDTGRKSWLPVEEMEAWRAERRQAKWPVRLYRLFFSQMPSRVHTLLSFFPLHRQTL